jgi:toxin FitB
MATRKHLVLDTSCMIALVAAWHEHHDVVTQAIDHYLEGRHRLAVVAHSLVEAYAVMTRLPAPFRVAPAVAHDLISANFAALPVAALSAQEHVELLAFLRDRGIAGGRSYDALLARAAEKLAPCVLLTLNARHFSELDAPGLTIAVP